MCIYNTRLNSTYFLKTQAGKLRVPLWGFCVCVFFFWGGEGGEVANTVLSIVVQSLDLQLLNCFKTFLKCYWKTVGSFLIPYWPIMKGISVLNLGVSLWCYWWHATNFMFPLRCVYCVYGCILCVKICIINTINRVRPRSLVKSWKSNGAQKWSLGINKR